MAAAIYSNAQATAKRLIAAYGQPVVLTHVASTVYDPATGSATQTTIDETVMVVEKSNSEKDADNSAILNSAKVLIMSPDVVSPPAVDDRITMEGKSYKVVNVNPVSPGGLVINYELELKL